MPTEQSKFRLPPDTLRALASLAASNGGNLTTAVKESAEQWSAAVAEAATLNANELSREDWTRLAHLNDPSGPLEEELDFADAPTAHGLDWSQRLAAELVGMWEGRELILPAHKEESRECRSLAKRIAKLGRVRGYALMAALRYFWRTQDAGIDVCVAPEIWMTPTAKK